MNNEIIIMRLASNSEREWQMPDTDSPGAQKSVQRFTDHREAVNYMMEQVKLGSPVYVFGAPESFHVHLTKTMDRDNSGEQQAAVSYDCSDNRMLDFVC